MFLTGITITIVFVGGGITFALMGQQHVERTVQHDQRQRMIDAGVLLIEPAEAALTQPDPFAEVWGAAVEQTVTLLPQNLAMPSIGSVSVPEVRVRAVTDGERIAFRLSWPDQTQDANVETDRFTDAAAMQFPLHPQASFMMGGPNMPVQIVHWKALWQKDIDEHFQDVQDLHPNYWADFYWFAEPTDQHPSEGTPYRVPDSFTDPYSHQWFPAKEAGNPMSVFHRTQPVEETTAEGFGSLATQDHAVTEARGVWRDGRWYLVLMRPLQTDDGEDYQFHPNVRGRFGVAIWEGGSENVGGRKQYSDWVPFEIMP